MEIRSEYDLIQAMSGATPEGEGKCSVTIKQQRCNAEGNLIEIDEEFISEKPIVQMFKQPGGFICVDLIFHSLEDKDLRMFYAYLSSFFTAANSTSDEEDDFPLLSVVFVPHEFEGKYWAIGLNPIFYSLTPEDVTGEPRIIRMAFMAQEDSDELPNFLFFVTPDSELESIRSEAEGEEQETSIYY